MHLPGIKKYDEMLTVSNMLINVRVSHTNSEVFETGLLHASSFKLGMGRGRIAAAYPFSNGYTVVYV